MSKRTDIKNEYLELFNSLLKGNISIKRGDLLRSSFLEVRDIIVKNKTNQTKKSQKNKEDNNEEFFIYDTRGENNIKATKIIIKELDGINYRLIIKENIVLKDKEKFIYFLQNHNLLKLIYNPFNENVGDNALRFFFKKFCLSLDYLNEKNNILSSSFEYKLLKNRNIVDIFNINQSKKSCSNLNNYLNNYLSGKERDKHIYSTFAAILLFLKYIKQKIQNAELYNNNLLIFYKLEEEIEKIRSEKLIDKEFINFLLVLTELFSNEQPSYERIIRNKWLNKNSEELHIIYCGFEPDQNKLIMELQKNDFLIETKKIINKNPCRFRFRKNKNV